MRPMTDLAVTETKWSTYRFSIILQNSMNGSSLNRRWSTCRRHGHRGSNRSNFSRVLFFFLFLRYWPKYAIIRHWLFPPKMLQFGTRQKTHRVEEIKGSYDKTRVKYANSFPVQLRLTLFFSSFSFHLSCANVCARVRTEMFVCFSFFLLQNNWAN